MTNGNARTTRPEADDEPARPPKKRPRILLVVVLAVGTLVLVANAAGTAWLLMQSRAKTGIDADRASLDRENKGRNDTEAKNVKADDKDKTREPSYLALDPPFVVNIGEEAGVRFLQVSIEVMTTDRAVTQEVLKHMPVIRNGLVMLLSAQEYRALNSPEGKERVRQAALEVIQKILQERTGRAGIDAVYFTSFVMQ